MNHRRISVTFSILFCLPLPALAQSFPGPPGWTKIPFSSFGGSENRSVCETPAPAGSVMGCVAILTAWSGCVVDTLRSRLVCWGGGHTDYSGNEQYALDLNTVAGGTCSATVPCWTRLTNYSPPNTSTSCVEKLADDRPNARHTYDGLAYLSLHDQALMTGGSLNYCGDGSSATWILDMHSLPTSCGTTSQSSTSPACTSTWTQVGNSGSTHQTSDSVCYDPLNDQVVMMDSASLYSYKPISQTWSVLNSNASYGDLNGTAVCDTFHQLVIRIGCYSTCGMESWSTTAGSKYAMTTHRIPPSCSGIVYSYPFLAYDPIHRDVVGLATKVENVIYHLEPETFFCWTETIGTTKGTDYPQDMDSNQVRMPGKHFAYFPGQNIFLLWNDYASDVWYLRVRR